MSFIVLATLLGSMVMTIHFTSCESVRLPDSPIPAACFVPTEETRELTKNQDMTCIWAHPGKYPPVRVPFNHFLGHCCIWEMPESGTFWLIGESVMSEIISVWVDSDVYRSTTEFELKPAQLLDVLVVDEYTQEPIENARVTVANDAVHLVSFTRMTDEDGYAVIPVLALDDYVMSVRADGYLAPNPMFFTALPDDMPKAIVELDPGIEILGKVTDFNGNPVDKAQLHVEIERTTGGTWNSDIDLPRAISAVATQNEIWAPSRGSYQTDERGLFRLQTLPRGKTRIYASHDLFAPSEWEKLDTTENTPSEGIPLVLKPTKRAWLRVENTQGAAIESTVTVFDRTTGQEISQINTPSSGAANLTRLPEHARFLITSDLYYPKQIDKDIVDNDEITVALDKTNEGRVMVEIRDGSVPMGNVTLSPASLEVRKQHPLCLAKTQSDGTATLESCPAEFWLDIYHPDFARSMIYIHSEDNSDKKVMTLSPGESVQIDMTDVETHEAIPDVSCQITTIFSSGNEKYSLKEEFSAANGQLKLEHRPQAEHTLQCTAPHRPSVKMNFTPPDTPKKMEFAHAISRTAVITDSLGGAVSYASLLINGESLESDYEGEVHLTGMPNAAIDVFHWQHGHAKSTLAEGSSPLEIRLPDRPDEDIIKCMHESHHIQTSIDGAAILIDQLDLPKGLKRGDGVERCSSREIVVIRDGRRIVF